MKDLVHKMRVAVVQAAPILFNKKATTKKVVNIVREAGRQGAQLIVFPESFIPCYPLGLTFGCYYLIKVRKMSPLSVILVLFVVAFLLGALGWMA